jgi:hypothetical protein
MEQDYRLKEIVAFVGRDALRRELQVEADQVPAWTFLKYILVRFWIWIKCPGAIGFV